MPSCPHYSGVDEALLRTAVSALPLPFWQKPTCRECSRKNAEIWLCLTGSCGFTGCGRLDNAHMVDHYNKQEEHCVVLNAKSMMIWCYACDDEITDAGDEVRKLILEMVKGPDSRKKNSGKATRSARVVKGTRGVVNIGNTCFLASAMQCLSHVLPFTKILRHCPPYSSHEMVSLSAQQRLVLAVRDFCVSQWGDPYTAARSSADGAIDPSDMLTAVQRLNSLFHGYQQHDSQEFLRFVLNTIHDDLKIKTPGKNNEYTSIVSDVFMGKTRSTITCLKCKRDSHCVEEFMDLSLPIPSEPLTRQVSPDTSTGSTSSWLWGKARALLGLGQEAKVSIYDCMHAFTRAEKLTGNDAYLCEHCKTKNDCMKQIAIQTLPEVMLVHLKRFTSSGWNASKLSRAVSFPVATDLDLSPFVTTQPKETKKFSKKKSTRDESPRNSENYRLAGFVQHMGSLGGGHYVAFCRHKSTGQWFCFDDSRVSLVTDLTVIENAEPYVLFFQRVNTPEVVTEKALVKSARTDLKSDDLTSYLPKRWVCGVQSMSRVPPLLTRDTVCVHGRPSTTCPDFAWAIFVKVPINFARRVLDQYGQDDAQFVESLESCAECAETISVYNYRLSAEHKLVSKLDTKSVPDGHKWNMIDAAWVRAWRQYLRQGAVADSRKMCDPGPIDNKALADRMGKADATNILKITSDYVAVNGDVWTVFSHCHGVDGPVLTSDTLDIFHAYAVTRIKSEDGDVSCFGLSPEEWRKISYSSRSS